MPLALYRSKEALGAPMPYVITNPSPTLRLHRMDRLFVLCGKQHVSTISRPDNSDDTDLQQQAQPPPSLPHSGSEHLES